ncbi:lariat debranching enzyme [Eurytemora carolleeae]|uniref:lariat debranching enzyme n=1 Tax=Eurytemora carolleeae TaxID=1294199 RepID=UPI000C7565BF|nr:lariat debranching enzyme [Eurytemora carolleeae]|eukprot:XP_023346155.1 lariat debranching enzyme-like [Eurytemora affinis]
MRIAVEGCTHGELDKIYSTVQELETKQGYKIDLLLCCGDFQSTRNLTDLKCMACPDKYKDMCSFYRYYSGEKLAPVLTVFIGGNHEASNYLQELAYGGWVAPNIYYLGYAGVINVNGVRIGGMSGIYKGFDYLFGHFEKPPYDDNTMRSCYHIRNVDVFRLKQLASNPPHIMLSHDWPRSVTNYGNTDQLMRFKKHFKDEIEQDKLGSPPTKEVLDVLKPEYWFSAHLHCKFAALVEHEDGSATKFLALDKCLPGRRFLQVVELGEPVGENDEIVLRYDKTWLAVLKSTNHLTSVERKTRYTPGPGSNERFDFQPTEAEIREIKELFKDDFEIPFNFEQSALAFKPTGARINMSQVKQPEATVNRQTTELCKKLGILDPMALLVGSPKRCTPGVPAMYLRNYVNEKETNLSMNSTFNPDEISLNEDEEIDDDDVDDVLVETVEEKTSDSSVPRTPISLPVPQLDNDDVDLVAVLDSTDKSSLETVLDSSDKSSLDTSQDNIFFIDKNPNETDSEKSADFTKPDPPRTRPDDPPVKKLKRRNASLYSAEDQD